MATVGSEYTSGIKYVRIAKVDANGIDNSLSLSSLSNLRIKYSDKTNPVNYPVVGITEYQDYYQYAVTTTSVTSSADNYKADWGLDVDKSSFAVSVGSNIFSSWTVNTDNLSILDNGTGEISIPISSNVFQNYYAAITSSGALGGTLYLKSSLRGTIKSIGSGGNPLQLGISGKVIPYAGEEFWIQFDAGSSGTIANAEWTMSPSGSYSDNNAAPALTLFEPYLTVPFYGTDCDVLYGNVEIVEPSNLYMDIDYSDNAIQAVNQDQLIAGTATRAPIQDFNYYSNRSIIPRYSGSKNISTYTYNSASSILNPFGGTNQPIERRDSIITEFDWGGGTYPEIYDGGGVQLKQHLFVGNTREDVNVQVTTEDGFVGTLEQTFPINSTPSIQQYTTVSGNAVDARVAGYGFSVPAKSTFMLPSQSIAQSISNALDTNGEIQLDATSNEGYTVTTTSAGYETTGSIVTGNEIYTALSESLAAGDQWYMTFYDSMAPTLQGELYPYTGDASFYAQRNDMGEYLDPLKSRGVWKVGSVRSSGTFRYITLEDSVSDFISSNITFGSSGGGKGWLLWKAKVNDNLMIFVDATMSGVGKSGMVTLTPTSVIEQNFDYITRTFGSNTTTS